jgi:hypothetical protein
VSVAGGLVTRIELPVLARDAVAFIAQNPARRVEYAIATYGLTVMLSTDGGGSWKIIAERGHER